MNGGRERGGSPPVRGASTGDVDGGDTLEKHAGPAAEPAGAIPAADDRDLSRLDGLADDLFGGAGPESYPQAASPSDAPPFSGARPPAGGSPEPAGQAGPWTARDVSEFLEGAVHPLLAARGVEPPGTQGVQYVSSRAATCLNIIFSKIDPNNPWGALAVAATTVYGFPVARAVRAQRAAAASEAESQPRSRRPETPEHDRSADAPEADPEPAAASAEVDVSGGPLEHSVEGSVEHPDTGLEAQAFVNLGAS